MHPSVIDAHKDERQLGYDQLVIATGAVPVSPVMPTIDIELGQLLGEEVVVSKRVVARERVRLRVETVTERRRISGEVRTERIEADKSSMRDQMPTVEYLRDVPAGHS